MNQFPSILIVSDGMPAKDAGGLSTTLYNLFDGYPKEKLHYLQFNDEINFKDKTPLTNNIYYGKVSGLKHLHNRLGKYFNPIISFINFSYRQISKPNLITSKNFENLDYILVCTSGPIKIQLAYLLSLHGKKGVIPYFMDDWPAMSDFSWIGGNITSLIKNLLFNSKAQVYISEELQSVFVKRYNLVKQKYFVVHNPVDFNKINKKPLLESVNNSSKIKKIIYAGSIWPMHADALLLFADVLEKLNSLDYEVQLDIYCPILQWEQYFANRVNSRVFYKGFVNYDHLSTLLPQASLLLITSSFAKQYYPITLTSIQTKTTDYMLAARPILFIGPDYSATNNFIKKFDCGFCFNKNSSIELIEFIGSIIENTEELNLKALNGYKAVKNNFSKEVVQKQFYEFISAI